MISQNQLFSKKITKELIQEVIEAFGLLNLNDKRWFSRETMKSTNTVEKMKLITKKLREYYLPCKARNYLYIITDKICITIFRQLLREFGYSLFSKEIYKNKKKSILYQLYKVNNVELVDDTLVNLDNKVNRISAVSIDNNPNYEISFHQ